MCTNLLQWLRGMLFDHKHWLTCDMLHITKKGCTIMQSFQGGCLNLLSAALYKPFTKTELNWEIQKRLSWQQILRLVPSTYRKLRRTRELHRWVEKEWLNNKKKIFPGSPWQANANYRSKAVKKTMLTVRPNINPNHIKLRVMKEPPCHTYQFYCSVCLLRRLACISLNSVLTTLENMVKYLRKNLGDPGNSGPCRQALAIS